MAVDRNAVEAPEAITGNLSTIGLASMVNDQQLPLTIVVNDD